MCECKRTLNFSLIHLWDESKDICFFVATIAIIFAVSTVNTHPCWQKWGWCLWLLVLVCFYWMWLRFLPGLPDALVWCGAPMRLVSVAHGQRNHMMRWLNTCNRLAVCSFIISGRFCHVKNWVEICEPHPVFWKLVIWAFSYKKHIFPCNLTTFPSYIDDWTFPSGQAVLPV
jgi:hypothetical protein